MHVDFETNINQPEKGHFRMNLDKSRLNISVRLFSEDNKELSNAPILPSTTKVDQLEQLYYSLLDIDLEEEQPPVHFRVAERSEDGGWIDIVDTLGVSLPSDCLVTEKVFLSNSLNDEFVFSLLNCFVCLRLCFVSGLLQDVLLHCLVMVSIRDRTFEQTLTGHQHWVLCIAWSHDGNKIASACKQGIILVWEYDSETNKFRLFKKLTGHKQWINALLASAGRDASIRIWDIIKSQTLFVLSGNRYSMEWK
ncbi:unnamed protein product [Meloidogyne enterolobii]|uniref:Uncharacterized protein n=1 Tax=Meloidogyne enterolobii TaxID=390850 RepID=A0ACB0YD71_MELEN